MENETVVTQPTPNNYVFELTLPNATAVLVLGILSIITCFCYGFFGLVFSIIALVLASKDNALYVANPKKYTLSSYNNLKAGRVCAIIGLSVSALFLMGLILAVFVGLAEGYDWKMY